MVPLESLRSLKSLRIFSVDTMCVNKREVTACIYYAYHSLKVT